MTTEGQNPETNEEATASAEETAAVEAPAPEAAPALEEHTRAVASAELRQGDRVTVRTGEKAGEQGHVTRVLPTQNTVRGKEMRYMYKTDLGAEHYRLEDLSSL